jgi:MFS family permease
MTSYRRVIVACGALMTCVAPFAAASIYSAEGFAGLGGRFLLGLLADRIGAKPELIGGLLLQSACVASCLFVNWLEACYALALLLGMVYGGVMPLYAVWRGNPSAGASWAP